MGSKESGFDGSEVMPTLLLALYFYREGEEGYTYCPTFWRLTLFIQILAAPHARMDIVASRGTPEVVLAAPAVVVNLDLSRAHVDDGGRTHLAGARAVLSFQPHPRFK